MKKPKSLIVVFIFWCLIFCGQSILSAKAEDMISYHNLTTDSVINYDDTAVKYHYNGVDVRMNDIGLLGESGSALAPLSDLFVNTLDVDCEFQLSDSSVTLKDGSDCVRIVPGSKSAVVNGKSLSMSEAPVLLKNTKNELLYYVPTRFIASNLGFDYEWNKVLSTVFISKTYTIRYTSDSTKTPICIPLSEGVSLTEIRVEDMYYDNQIAVYIPGNHIKEYENNCIINHYPVISDIELSYNASDETAILFKTSDIVACKPEVGDNKLYLSFLPPREVYSKIVVIDAGHGGYDPGAIRDKTNESDLNLSIAYEYTKDLFANSDIKVYYTRVSDKFISLDNRAAFSSKVGADLFVSVHQNTFTTDAKKGISVYYSSDNKHTGPSGLTGRIMAGMFADSLSEKLELKNLGRLNQRLSVTTYNTVPAALIELAFMSNPDDFQRLRDSEFRKEAGQAIFDTIIEIFEAYPTGR